MPTYYPDCGCRHSDEPIGHEVFAPGLGDARSCEDCDGYDEPCDCSECTECRERELEITATQRPRVAQAISLLPVSDLPNMLIPGLRRSVSCEWEGSAGVSYAAMELDDLGESGAVFNNVDDGTCDGEIVFSRLGLEDGIMAERYGRSLALLQRLKDAGYIRVGENAGHHIHVSAVDHAGNCFTPNALVTLYSVYAHCEDLLYRLASAGWRRHRTEGSSGYANGIPQIGRQKKTPKNVGVAIADDRYYGLNVSRFIGAMARCRCGAYRFGDWGQCECGDEGKTIEWRLWNSAVSARKIRTYIVISHLITDYAANHTTDGHADLESNPWAGTDHVDEDSLARQLTFLLSLPGLTKRDREDIRWLVSISPGMGDLSDSYSLAYAGGHE